jgi:hypothetical protein
MKKLKRSFHGKISVKREEGWTLIAFMYTEDSWRSEQFYYLNRKVKVKLFLYLIKHHAMKTYKGVEI